MVEADYWRSTDASLTDPGLIYQLIYASDVASDVVIPFDVFTRGGPQCSAKILVFQQFLHVHGHAIDIPFLDQEPGFTVNNDIRNTSMPGSHDRQGSCARLEDSDRRAFTIAISGCYRVLYKTTSLRKQLKHLFMPQCTGEGNL